MKLLVMMTFDLERATPSDYDGVEIILGGIGLGRSFSKDGAEPIRLPYNTFGGWRDCFSSKSEALSFVKQQLKALCPLNQLFGRAFVSASEDADYCGFEF